MSDDTLDPGSSGGRHARGETIGRFVVLGLIGAGGMGEVYAAYDPDLDRKVAVKLLRPTAAQTARDQTRLLREAQAVAKLSHPNVVVVYEVGKVGDAVFIAMEHVDGQTVGGWMKASPRSWPEIVRVFTAAGRGLAAAHAAGLVHRDFKPENVMMTKDGQVRVMDFGLARALDADERSDDTASPGTPGTALDLKLTQTGQQLGTPAYMAPEQFMGGGTVDARSDQFSFCVAIYEALYGERPFSGNTLLSLMTSVVEGRIRPPAANANVPARIRRALLRGLATDPNARFPSMAALIDVLEKDPSARRRAWAAVAAGVLGVAGVALAVGRAGSGSPAPCGGGASRLAGVWESAGVQSTRKEAIRAAFAKVGKSYAVPAYDAMGRLLDDYTGRWVAMHRDVCEATNVRGEQSAEVLDLRMGCLDERLRGLRALVDVVARPDDGIVRNAVGAAAALQPLEGCADVAELRAVVKPPQDPVVRKRVHELREELARVTAMRDSGQCAATESRGARLLEEVKVTGYQPLIADMLSSLVLLGYHCGDPRTGIERSKRAYAAAVAGRQDTVATWSAANAALFAADRLGDLATARDWVLIARGSLARQSRSDLSEAGVLDAEGALLGLEGNEEARLAKVRASHALTAKALGPDHPYALVGLMNIGDSLFRAGHVEEAVSQDRVALAAAERVYGRVHDLVAAESLNLCEALNGLGRFPEALAACGRSLSVFREIGADPANLAYVLTGLGTAHLGQGHAEQALGPLQEAVSAREAGKVAPALLGASRFALARALWTRPATRPRALAVARQARADISSDAKAVAAVDAWLAKPVPR